MLNQTMTAIEITRAGGPEVLSLTTRPLPQAAAGQVLIKVAFAGINRHDCGQRNRGFGPKGATDIPGLEVAGEVAAVGAGVTRWKVGDAVCALVNAKRNLQALAMDGRVMHLSSGDSKEYSVPIAMIMGKRAIGKYCCRLRTDPAAR